ncbi:hypothetical protein OPT61_g9749 [Boeremia exigua]|uniref:Uncharacterized protein n=1 Tax=Boeremia exigua TaxID=749465 RepID=A0ACC2HTL2_9PLEO|nr:hypothetical protein OPT61_g9749 [Boeremia exigua]
MMGLYDLIPLQTDQIRLLRVGLDDARKIQCTITVHALSDETIGFSALSYTWGPCHQEGVKLCRPPEFAGPSRTILCNKSLVELTENLYDFLCQWVTEHDTSTYLWVDALCIDQSNITERSHQVHIMGEIYTTAKHIFIWLGPEDESTGLAFELMKDLSSMKPSEREELEPRRVSTNNESPLLDLTRWVALSRFFARTWFSRVWVIQEAVFARSRTIMCGSHTTSWEILTDISTFLATSHWSRFLKDSASFKDHTNHWHNTPARLLAQCKNWEDAQKDGLLYALIRARPSLCQDPRDKVYSQLHLGHANIFPNYRHSETEVYIIVAEYILKQSGNMLLLTCVEGEEFQTPAYHLPSWVPDWSVTEFVGLRVTGYRHFHAAGARLPVYSISPDKRILSVEAAKVDEIVEICEEKKKLRANLHSSSLWGLVSRLNSTWSTTTGTQTREEILWRVLMTNRGTRPVDRKIEYPASMDCQKSFRSWVLWRYASATEVPTKFPLPSTADSILPTQDELEETRSRATANPAYLEELAHEASSYDHHFLSAMLQRPFRTKQGCFGIGTQCLREGDSIWIVSGCRVPIILRPVQDSEHYRLVGGSYTHGLMDGEGLRRQGIQFKTVSLE